MRRNFAPGWTMVQPVRWNGWNAARRNVAIRIGSYAGHGRSSLSHSITGREAKQQSRNGGLQIAEQTTAGWGARRRLLPGKAGNRGTLWGPAIHSSCWGKARSYGPFLRDLA